MRIRHEPWEIATLPPGDYFVGDPAYCFPSTKLWEEWVTRAESGGGDTMCAADVAGHPVAACQIVSGIGDVVDQDGFEYVEDSGLIGVVPAELASEDVEHLRRASFHEDFDVFMSGPVIHIGNLRIDASEDYDDEEDEMDDLVDAKGSIPIYELRAHKSEAHAWVVPRFKLYHRELSVDRDELEERLADGRIGDGLEPPIQFRLAQAGVEGDLLWTKDSDVTVASKRLVAALRDAGMTGFTTFDIHVQDSDLGDRHLGFVAHRVLGGSDVFAPYRSVRTSSFMVNQRAMDVLQGTGATDMRISPAG